MMLSSTMRSLSGTHASSSSSPSGWATRRRLGAPVLRSLRLREKSVFETTYAASALSAGDGRTRGETVITHAGASSSGASSSGASGASRGRRGPGRADVDVDVDREGLEDEDGLALEDLEDNTQDDQAIREERVVTPEEELKARIAARRDALFPGRRGKGGQTRRGEKVETNESMPNAETAEPNVVPRPAAPPTPMRESPSKRGGGAPPPVARRPVSSSLTELVWVFERRGDGWGEEILPSIRAERRVVDREIQKKALSSGEELLVEEYGLSSDEAVAALSAAAAWRTTKRGRALVDKRRMRLAQQNIVPCTRAMVEAGASKEDIAAIIRSFPIILSVIPDDDENSWNYCYIEYIVRTKSKDGGSKGRIRTKNFTGRRPKNRPTDRMRNWVLDQRVSRKRGTLTTEQMFLLDSGGFDEDKYVTVLEAKQKEKRVWERTFEELIEFQRDYGITNPPYEPGSTGLGAWLEEQRESYRKGELNAEKEARLRRVGIAFDVNEAVKQATDTSSIRYTDDEPIENVVINTEFTEFAKALREFMDEYGEYEEPQIGSPLGVWLMRTRAQIRDEALSEENRTVLNALNLEISYIPESWISMLNMYANMRARRSSYLGVDIARVRAWQREQLDLMRRNDGSLSEAQLQRLRHVGSADTISGLVADALRSGREERARGLAEFEARRAARQARKKNGSVESSQDEEDDII